MGSLSRPATAPGGPVPIKRLSVNLPEPLHRRFKTACSAMDRNMAGEIQQFVERRTLELEYRARGNTGEWSGQAVTPEQPSSPVESRLRAIDRALDCNHPTGDIDEMLADIGRGRDIR